MTARTPVVSDRQGFDRRWFAPNLERVYNDRTRFVIDTTGLLDIVIHPDRNDRVVES